MPSAIQLDRISKSATNLISFKAPADFNNGYVFYAEDLVSGERELFTASQFATATLTTKSVYVNGSVEINYEAGKTIADYYTPNGTPGRGILLRPEDIITITDDAISGTTVVGQYVAPQNASYQLAISASVPTSKFIGKVIEKTTLYGKAASVIKVLAN